MRTMESLIVGHTVQDGTLVEADQTALRKKLRSQPPAVSVRCPRNTETWNSRFSRRAIFGCGYPSLGLWVYAESAKRNSRPHERHLHLAT